MNDINITVFVIHIDYSKRIRHLVFALKSDDCKKLLIFIEECAKLLGGTSYIKSEHLYINHSANSRSFRNYEHLRDDIFRDYKYFGYNTFENSQTKDIEWEAWIKQTDELWNNIK